MALKPGTYEADLLWKGRLAKTYTINVDPADAKDLRTNLLHLMRQYRNDKEPYLKHYALRLRRPGTRPVKSFELMTFTAAK